MDGLLHRRVFYARLGVQNHVLCRHLPLYRASEFVEGVVTRLRYLTLIRLPVGFRQKFVAESLGHFDDGLSVAVEVRNCHLESLGNVIIVAVGFCESLGPWASACRPSNFPRFVVSSDGSGRRPEVVGLVVGDAVEDRPYRADGGHVVVESVGHLVTLVMVATPRC